MSAGCGGIGFGFAARALGFDQRKSCHVTVFAPIADDLFEGFPARAIGFAQIPAILRGIAIVVEIARRAFLLKEGNVDCRRTDKVHPGFLCLESWLDRSQAAVERFLDDVGDVVALPAELVRRRRKEPALNVARKKLVRELVGHGAVQGPEPVVPVLIERKPIAALDLLNTPPAIEIAGDFESAGAHEAVDLVLHALVDEAVR